MHKVRPIRGIPFGVLPHAQGRHEDFGIRRMKGKGLGEGAPFYDNYACIQYHEVSRLMICARPLAPGLQNDARTHLLGRVSRLKHNNRNYI